MGVLEGLGRCLNLEERDLARWDRNAESLVGWGVGAAPLLFLRGAKRKGQGEEAAYGSAAPI
jgi:hypothetical protein